MKTRRLVGLTVAALIAIALLAVALPAIWQRSVSAEPVPREVSPRGALLPEEQATIRLFETARPAVVYITTQARVVDAWTRNAFNIPRGSGSGFIWDDRGHVVTNNHVVAEASAANVRLTDGRDVPASLVGVSPAHDLAVIKIDVSKQPPALPIGRTGR
jgi:S1-C subfamily serine protease